MATVFIVDDDLSIMKLIKMLLEGNGFQVVGTALNGQIAIDKIRTLSEKPDVVIMDYRMPIKNGIEATVEIMKMSNRSKIIFASADDEIKEEALEVGVLSVVSKPFNFEELLSSIKNSLNEK